MTARTSLVLSSLLCCLVACGDTSDPQDSGNEDATGSSPGDTGSHSNSSAADNASDASMTASSTVTGSASGSETSGSETSGPGTPACSVDVLESDPCIACAASECEPSAGQCCGLQGCLEALSCTLETGCQHAECLAPETCQAEIDAAGGIGGEALTVMMELGPCLGAAIASSTEASCAECAKGQTGR